MDATCLLANEAGLEEHLGATEALAANCNDVAIRKLVSLLLVRALGCRLHLCIVIESNVRELLLHIPHDLALRCGGERVPSLSQDLHHVLSEISARQVQTEDGMWQCIPLVDGHCVGHTISRIHHDAGGAARGIEGEHCLDRHVHGRAIEGFEHDLCHALTIGFRIQGRLGEEDWMLFGSNPQFVVECVMPGMLGLPTMEGKTARGASSPAKPALHMPEPLSTTSAATSSSSPMLKKDGGHLHQCLLNLSLSQNGLS